MTWHYRIGVVTQAGEKTYGIIEFYPRHGRVHHIPEAWTGFQYPQSGTVEGLRRQLVNMRYDTYRDETPIELEGP